MTSTMRSKKVIIHYTPAGQKWNISRSYCSLLYIFMELSVLRYFIKLFFYCTFSLETAAKESDNPMYER